MKDRDKRQGELEKENARLRKLLYTAKQRLEEAQKDLVERRQLKRALRQEEGALSKAKVKIESLLDTIADLQQIVKRSELQARFLDVAQSEKTRSIAESEQLKVELSNAQAQVERLRTVEEEKRTLAQLVKTKENEVACARREIDRLEQQSIDFTLQKQLIKQLQQENQAKSDELAKREQELRQMRQWHQDARGSQEQLREQVTAKQRALDALQIKTQELCEQLAQIERRPQMQKAALNSDTLEELEKMKLELEAKSALLQEARDEAEEAKEALHDAQAQTRAAEGRYLTTLRDRMHASPAELEEAEALSRDLRQELHRWQQRYQTLEHQARHHLRAAKEEVRGLQGKLSEAETHHQEGQRTLAQRLKQVNLLQAEVDERQLKIEELHERLQKSEVWKSKCESAEKELEKQQIMIVDLKKEKEEHENLKAAFARIQASFGELS